MITYHKWRLTWQLNADIADRRVTGAGAFTRQRASMSIGTTRNTASGAVRRPTVRAAFIRRRASIDMAPARTSAFGAARPPTVPVASTVRPVGMRSKINDLRLIDFRFTIGVNHGRFYLRHMSRKNFNAKSAETSQRSQRFDVCDFPEVAL